MATNSAVTRATPKIIKPHGSTGPAGRNNSSRCRGQWLSCHKDWVERSWESSSALRGKSQGQCPVDPQKQGRGGKHDGENNRLYGKRGPEHADIADRREPRPIHHHAACGAQGHENNRNHDAGHSDQSPAHAPSPRNFATKTDSKRYFGKCCGFVLQNSKSVALDDRGIEAVAGPKDLKQFSNSGICASSSGYNRAYLKAANLQCPNCPLSTLTSTPISEITSRRFWRCGQERPIFPAHGSRSVQGRYSGR